MNADTAIFVVLVCIFCLVLTSVAVVVILKQTPAQSADFDAQVR